MNWHFLGHFNFSQDILTSELCKINVGHKFFRTYFKVKWYTHFSSFCVRNLVIINNTCNTCNSFLIEKMKITQSLYTVRHLTVSKFDFLVSWNRCECSFVTVCFSNNIWPDKLVKAPLPLQHAWEVTLRSLYGRTMLVTVDGKSRTKSWKTKSVGDCPWTCFIQRDLCEEKRLFSEGQWNFSERQTWHVDMTSSRFLSLARQHALKIIFSDVFCYRNVCIYGNLSACDNLSLHSALFRLGHEVEFGGGVHYDLPSVLDSFCQPLPAPVSPAERSQQSQLYSLWRSVQLPPVTVLPSRQEAPPERGTQVYHLWESVHSDVEQKETHGNHSSGFCCHHSVAV